MAEQSMLEIVQDVCRRQGLDVPSAVVGSTDQTILQLWGLLNEEVEEHTFREITFPQLRSTTTFGYSTDPSYNAYSLAALAGFRWIVPKTLWNVSTRLRVDGPVPDPTWVAMLTMDVAPAVDSYRISGDYIQIYPGSSTIETFTFDWYSAFGVLGATGYQQNFQADTDSPRLPAHIVKMGLRYRWRREKGQPYAEEMRAYEKALAELAHRSPVPGDLSLDNVPAYDNVAAPGLLIAAGSWPV